MGRPAISPGDERDQFRNADARSIAGGDEVSPLIAGGDESDQETRGSGDFISPRDTGPPD